MQNYFSLFLFSFIAWKRAIWQINCVSMLSMMKWFASYKLYNPSLVRCHLSPKMFGNI